MSDDFGTRYVGDTSRPLECTFTTHDGSVDVLTYATNMTLHFRNRTSGVRFTGTGTWTVTDGANGIAAYTWAAADVATPGFYDIQVSATLADGPAHWDARMIEIQATF